ncbi:MAG: hypothetical protein IT422_11085 [Pirellulaceae bacterium]|nr:hypothetical protein [Pirellulaceae bacterium]
MRSLSENYRESHANTHETFADLVFCALVVLILFVLALTVEVSQRVRAATAAMKPVEEVVADDMVDMTPEEIQELARKLQQQQAELAKLRSETAASSSKVRGQLAAMAGEQRFTGAREPAAFSVAYNYKTQRYHFVPSKDLNHADRRESGESDIAYLIRKRQELAEIALAARQTRAFTRGEVQRIFTAMSQYKVVTPTTSSYKIDDDRVGLYYHVLLCEYIAGDVSSDEDHEAVIVDAILAMGEHVGPPNEDMYPRCVIHVDQQTQQLTLGGVQLHPLDLRTILLSVEGRGLMLDFEGYDDQAPKWLYEQVLAPAGYVGKTPKAPAS